MPIYKISLSDGLRHHGYSWPRTLISYPVRLTTQRPPESMKLLDRDLKEIPFQLAGTKEVDGGLETNVYFITGLPYGAEYAFSLEAFDGEDAKKSGMQKGIVYEESGDAILAGNRQLLLKVFKNAASQPDGRYHIFRIEGIFSGIACDAYLTTGRTVETCNARVVNNGCVFAELAVEIGFSGGGSYAMKLRIADGMEFIELKEEMGIPEEGGDDRLLLEWRNFSPDKRFIRTRGYEKIDQYNENEYMPFKLLPYSNWVNWWESRAAAFSDSKKGISTGVFIKDAGEWDYGRYALWSSPDTHAVRFKYSYSQDLQGSLVWEYPIGKGNRSTAVAIYDSSRDKECLQGCHIEYLWFWYEYISLDKVKSWILRWEEDRNAYPRFFKEDSIPENGVEVWHHGIRKEPFSPEFMEEMAYKLSQNMNRLYETGPVAAREFFSWVYVFDMAAPKMTREQFDDLKACCAFMAYVHMDENFMPIEKVLAGHPNFLADVRSVPALMASLFPGHPHCRRWIDQFEKAMTLNFKYHLRPDVKAWNSKGGRWTENLGCYNFAFLIPAVRTATLVQKSFGDNVLMNPFVEKWVQWMLDALTAPVDGMRTYPPQGAHSGHYLDPMIPTLPMRLLAERLFRYSPLLSEYLLNVCRPDAPSFEEKVPGSDIYRYLLDKGLMDNNGTRPCLKSSKYTGYGFVLRASVGDENEVSVHLQQIDEGPNYRWGRAGQGGCGVIYYNAAGKRYSYNRPEDVGDANMGDVQGCCNFGILDGHEYKSVGRNDLTEPLYDFGFAQFAQVNAGEYSRPFYRSRSVILSGNDYIVIYDAVGDMRVSGRFAWFVKEGEELPHILQLKPGVPGIHVGPGVPAEEYGNHVTAKNQSKGIIFDGSGDFLTLVSHRPVNSEFNTYAEKTVYGAEVRMAGRIDRIFRDSALIRHEDSKCCFTGYAGIVRLFGDSRAEAALFKGTKIGALGVEASILSPQGSCIPAGISFSLEGGRLAGMAVCQEEAVIRINLPGKWDIERYRLYINSLPYEYSTIDDCSFSFKIPRGSFSWQWTDRCPRPEATFITGAVAESGGVTVAWQPANGADSYRLDISRDGGKSWSTALAQIKGNSCKLTGLENGIKMHVRVRAENADSFGEWSHDYPVYITNKVPDRVEGLKVWKTADAFRITWGRQLGVEKYRLYRREKGSRDYSVIYEGPDNEYIDIIPAAPAIYEYAASAINGNGEGEKSVVKDTGPDGTACWDPEPECGFRRYTPSHEYGYNGFNHWHNLVRRELLYPI